MTHVSHVQRLYEALGEAVHLTTPANWNDDGTSADTLHRLLDEIRADAVFHNSALQTVLDHHHPDMIRDAEHPERKRHVDRKDLPDSERIAADFATFDVGHLSDPVYLATMRAQTPAHIPLPPLESGIPEHIALVHDAALTLFNQVGIYMTGPKFRRNHHEVHLQEDDPEALHTDAPGGTTA